jgi:D-psicose/D-tagatose/L-ribulose 3-epimerase
LSGRLGVEAMVFGSPKNRRRDSLPFEAACDIAVPFFRSLGKIADDCGTWLCIEPNPTDYGCDFITTAAEGQALVTAVDQPGFGLHLDAAGMTLSNDSSDVIVNAGAWLRHFHISEPHLAPLAPKTAVSRHADFAHALARARYPGWTSIEMKRTESYRADITAALDYGSSYYVNREC